MENFKAVIAAVLAGLMLVTIMYLAYIMIPLLILISIVTVVFLVSRENFAESTKPEGSVGVVW